MGRISKGWALSLILVMAISSLTLLAVKPANAQNIPTPSVPEFTIELTHNEVYLTINNQQFPSTINGYNESLYYDVRIKPDSSLYWADQYPPYMWNNTAFNEPNNSITSFYLSNSTPAQWSSLKYTVLTFILNYENGAQVDFEVEAILGHDSQVWGYQPPSEQFKIPQGYYFEVPAVALDANSSWSPPQTATIHLITSPAPTPSPLFSNSSLLLIALAVIAIALVVIAILLVVIIAVIVRHRSVKHG